MQNFSKYVLTITVGYSIIMEYCPGDRRKSKREKYRDLLEGHTKAQHQHIIVRGKANAINDHGTKGHIAASQD